MVWRLARSLDVLTAEIRALHPGTTVWTIGDPAHRSRASDHNPNAAGVVCAADVLGDKGLDLAAFAAHLVADPHPALKYVIYRRRIASRSSGWQWRPYTGSNPHDTHVHVSVGTGPDGKSTGAYDDTSPWGLASISTGGSEMLCKRGDKGPVVEALQRLLQAVGHSPGAIDSDYGPATSRALLAARKEVGTTATSGDQYSAAAYVQLLQLLARRHAGQPGRNGTNGKDGAPGAVDYGRLVDELLARLATTQGQARE